MTAIHRPGSLVRARGREWVVLPGSDRDSLWVRPLAGTDADRTLIHIPVETDPVESAEFPDPVPGILAAQDTAQLLRDALMLSLRRGAGPFRSFGNLAVEPRVYQLVPLMMALRLDPVRLLIADDVGIGKTIEAGMIAREYLDRGDIDRFTVLCPPHLVDQWVRELDRSFNLSATAVTASGATRLERDIPQGRSIFDAHPVTVVSLDYIKNPDRRAGFVRACPDFVIVDEAHTCASTGEGRHLRFELLRTLAADPKRHLVMLTATPHSGDDGAFHRLLGLIDVEFGQLAERTGDERNPLRERLARHFVQRRRADLAEWQDQSRFPTRMSAELPYTLTGEWQSFLEDILDYCGDIVARAGTDERRQRMSFWSTLALMRCVASSPAAAVQALRTRAGDDPDLDTTEDLMAGVLDGTDADLVDDDTTPALGTPDPLLGGLIARAERLAGLAGDPKLRMLVDNLRNVVREGFTPIVFCRYIQTAAYLRTHLAEAFKDRTVEAITGELPASERERRVEALAEAVKPPILVATDCLSEGVNLQHVFDAVVHYDLSWNPTRHEQREGRVDRYGQPSPSVRATLIYGANNPVDGAVLEVILRKARKIREELGVPVPVPDNGPAITHALMKAVLMRRRRTSSAAQLTLGLADAPENQTFGDELEIQWRNAADREVRNRTVFAQRRLKPDDVRPEWDRSVEALGGQAMVERFVTRACARLNATPARTGRRTAVPLGGIDPVFRERLESAGLTGTIPITYDGSPRGRTMQVTRSHPLVTTIAETLLERTLGQGTGSAGDQSPVPTTSAPPPGVLGRTGCWVTGAVRTRTTVALLRLRHTLSVTRAGVTRTIPAEDATSLAWVTQPDTTRPDRVTGAEASALLDAPVSGEPPVPVRDRQVRQALEDLKANRDDLDAFARSRADVLLADHRRVREAADARGLYAVTSQQPADVVALFVLLPRTD